jgi:nucleotide-binding universal stress UspA family protein
MKILIAVDGSDYSKAAARSVARLTAAFYKPAQIELLHVHAPLPYPGVAAAVGRKAIGDYQRDTSQEALEVAEKELGKAGITYRSTWIVGDVAQEVARFVRKNGIDLVVCGSHGHGALANLAMGSVATRLIATVPAPVMVVTREAVGAMRNKKAA